mmetsp:Transcript_41579/g.66886  ORF Transcript_41579/g.66886 Transcript_41579/m.66886 type:complete len:166 (+) Transcript_41579:1-498(+)
MQSYLGMMEQLMKQKLSGEDNELNAYFNQAFAAFTDSQQMIKIDLKKLARDFPVFAKIFVFNAESETEAKIENLLLFDNICSIFRNCVEVQCDMGSGGGAADAAYFEKLTGILNSVCSNKAAKLRNIKVIKCKYSDEDLNAFQEKNADWNIEKMGSTKLSLSRKD